MTTHHVLAARLRNAYRHGPVVPLRDGLEVNDANGAYVVQQINTAHWLAAGRRIVGRKIGLTAKSVQAQLGVSQPDYGTLFDDMGVEDGGELPIHELLQPKVEAEVALVLGRDLDSPRASVRDLVAATAYAVPAIEIVDSRITEWKISLADTVADNASAGAYVIGQTPRLLAGLDLYSCGMVLEVNGNIVSVGAGAACLDHPLKAAAWLARTFASLGEKLTAGDLILTGALGPMFAIHRGDVVTATVGGLGTCRFSCAHSGTGA